MKATTKSINEIRSVLETGKPAVKRDVELLLANIRLTKADFLTTSQRLLTTEDLELRAILFAVQYM